LVTSSSELKEALKEVCGEQATCFALGRLVKHGEVIRISIGTRRFYFVPDIQEKINIIL